MMSVSDDRTMLLRDGKPFFYLADTCWAAFTNITQEEWDYYLYKRKAQGFNALQINILPQWDASTSALSHHPFALNEQGEYDYHRICTAYFRHARQMCIQAKQAGFTLSLVVLWCNYVPGTWVRDLCHQPTMPMACIEDYVKIVHESFSDLHPMYVIAGDTDFPIQETIDTYVYAAGLLRKLAKECLFTVHLKGRYTQIPPQLHEMIDLCFYQSGHNAQNLATPYQLAETMRCQYPNKPLINAEPCYEEMGYSRRMYGRWTRRDVRRAAWMSVLSGASAGIAYGAAGIYGWHQVGQQFGKDKGEGFDTPKCWQEALQFMGAWDYGYLRYLMEYDRLMPLTPRQEWLMNETTEIRVAQAGDCTVLYVPFQTSICLRPCLHEYRATVIDLENRFVAAGNLVVRKGHTWIDPHPFHEDVLILIEPGA